MRNQVAYDVPLPLERCQCCLSVCCTTLTPRRNHPIFALHLHLPFVRSFHQSHLIPHCTRIPRTLSHLATCEVKYLSGYVQLHPTPRQPHQVDTSPPDAPRHHLPKLCRAASSFFSPIFIEHFPLSSMASPAFSPSLPLARPALSTHSSKCPVAAVRASAVEYGRIQHCGVLVKDTEASKSFYMNVFGMEDEDYLRNPKLPFNGSFLRAGASQIHLMELPNPDPLTGRPAHGGR